MVEIPLAYVQGKMLLDPQAGSQSWSDVFTITPLIIYFSYVLKFPYALLVWGFINLIEKLQNVMSASYSADCRVNIIILHIYKRARLAFF